MDTTNNIFLIESRGKLELHGCKRVHKYRVIIKNLTIFDGRNTDEVCATQRLLRIAFDGIVNE